jgi:predicted nucleotide-binding protein
LIERFQGEDGARRLREALAASDLIAGDPVIADAVASVGVLRVLQGSDVLIKQGGSDNDLFIILSGETAVLVHGREVARRAVGDHVGEMALIDPSAKRSATVFAMSECVVLGISEPAFSKLAERYPVLWRRFAKQIADRLRQRGALVHPKREKPELFIGSSTESLELARAIQTGLKYDPVVVRIWTDGVFGASSYTLDSLESQLDASDFGALVLSPDDLVFSEGSGSHAPRDNVILELGMFIGRLGRKRTYLVQATGVDLKLPSDVDGVTPLTYVPGKAGDLAASIGPVCSELRELIAKHGPR